MSQNVPSYRRKKSPNGDYAIVTLPDGSGGRRDVLLGRHGTPESRQEYLRVIAEWEANGRRLQAAKGADLSINELALGYWNEVDKHRQQKKRASDGESHSLRSALRPLKELYGHTQASKFGPLALKAVRERMIATKTPGGEPWSRSFVNASIGRIKAMFKWATENELLPATISYALGAVRGLQRGRTQAREAEEVKPVPLAFVDATIPHAASPVAAMVELQLLTAMRPGEIVIMRAIDINMSGRIWFYTPEYFKNQWRGHARSIAIGPEGQKIVKRFLTTDLSAYLFSPRQAMEEHRQKLRSERQTKVQPSQTDRKKKNPRKTPGERYGVNSYRRAIKAAAAKADAKAHRERPEVPAGERIIPEWAPNQLRHTRATELRKEFGLDAARCILGHRTARVTEVYAELDAEAATVIMGKIG